MHRLYELDLNLCLKCNRIVTSRPLELLFRAASRLGDGLIWYALMAGFPLLYGDSGWLISAHMLAAGVPALLVYRYLKYKTLRPRPCAATAHIQQKTRALDEFSFPSGHTLHAACFTAVICGHIPDSTWLLVPFAALVAVSRPVLGLHYPSDVLAGAALGTAIAAATWLLPWFAY
jgi:undecaprenyl-diphosphatase